MVVVVVEKKKDLYFKIILINDAGKNETETAICDYGRTRLLRPLLIKVGV